MNKFTTVGLSALTAATALFCADAQAAVVEHSIISNAVNYCQAFTPGPANTIRNRVVGSENVGATMNVACNFHSMGNNAAGLTSPRRLSIYFSNNSAAAISITCTLLTSFQGSGSGYAVSKTVSVAAGSQATQNLTWSQTDNPTAGATDLGSRLIGVNCTLPTGAVINDTYLYWNQDNGV